ncbi:uncharacterized protein K460DRAFT_355592 [Cucurbitaria berberidis CBS 394.84]|uniref:Uncharacterized protein n=1 Tax=Cucurbitaria berberidis CBS 394.84 TaxID=1168544 RepID=A0A9P4GHT0_9PLEO|nr:uncharacterized protein K460DRAFT_355592 [Cucurbitaria berberidis CBS 394.84]KAF1845835.1 hypothetical protein K460DRAFT_355592 [Cucurbitaria berberidis CBS 394.84]
MPALVDASGLLPFQPLYADFRRYRALHHNCILAPIDNPKRSTITRVMLGVHATPNESSSSTQLLSTVSTAASSSDEASSSSSKPGTPPSPLDAPLIGPGADAKLQLQPKGPVAPNPAVDARAP